MDFFKSVVLAPFLEIVIVCCFRGQVIRDPIPCKAGSEDIEDSIDDFPIGIDS